MAAGVQRPGELPWELALLSAAAVLVGGAGQVAQVVVQLEQGPWGQASEVAVRVLALERPRASEAAPNAALALEVTAPLEVEPLVRPQQVAEMAPLGEALEAEAPRRVESWRWLSQPSLPRARAASLARVGPPAQGQAPSPRVVSVVAAVTAYAAEALEWERQERDEASAAVAAAAEQALVLVPEQALVLAQGVAQGAPPASALAP